MTLLFISGGLTVMVILCVVAYNKGYDAGYGQAYTDVRKWHPVEDITP